MANYNLFSYLSNKIFPSVKSTKLKTGIKTNIIKTSKNTHRIQVIDPIMIDSDGNERPVFSPDSPIFRPFISESKVN